MPAFSETSSKKRKKSSSTGAQSPSKKSKKNPDENAKTHGREFHVVKASLVVSVPPVFAGNPRNGVEEMLDSMVMRYIPALQGVVLSHSNLIFVSKTADIKDDCPFLVSKVEFEATIWNPRVGMTLMGRVNLCSPDHVSLLVHRTFNVSIPRHHIPRDQWEFEYGPAENDPEFGAAAQEYQDNAEQESIEGKREADSDGKWIHKLTGEKLGDKSGFLQFTVIGLTVANEMLSLLGSIQPDPFSPEHEIHSKPREEPDQDDIYAEESDVENVDAELDEVSDDENGDEDTFRELGKRVTVPATQVKHLAEEGEQRVAASEKENKRKAKKDDENSKGKKKRKKP